MQHNRLFPGVTGALSREGRSFVSVPANFRSRAFGSTERLTLASPDTSLLGDLPDTRMRIKSGAALYRAGDPFASLYAVRSGFFKTRARDEKAREQVIGFQMLGDVLGMDGLATDRYCLDAIALEDSEVFVIPYRQTWNPEWQAGLNKVMSRELARDNGVLTMLGALAADRRVASFLVSLSRRLRARGLSPVEFHLRMTRRDIGSYLGTSLETVSRAFSRMAERGLISVDQKHVWIRDMPGLKTLAESETL